MSNSNAPKESKHSAWSWVRGQRENIQTIVIALLLAFCFRTFVAEGRYVASSSMEPTLQVNDRLIVEKLSYDFTQPERGQVIVFMPPKQTNIDQALIKRIVGLPGDTVEVADGKVIVNGVPQNELYTAEAPKYPMSVRKVPPDYYFVMGDSRNNSYDSHMWGFLPRANIIGRAFFRYWPIDQIGSV